MVVVSVMHHLGVKTDGDLLTNASENKSVCRLLFRGVAFFSIRDSEKQREGHLQLSRWEVAHFAVCVLHFSHLLHTFPYMQKAQCCKYVHIGEWSMGGDTGTGTERNE